jgi:hypothetical protein
MNYPADNPGIKKRWCKNAPALFGRTDRLLEEDFSPTTNGGIAWREYHFAAQHRLLPPEGTPEHLTV